jgi:hypothetical protein
VEDSDRGVGISKIQPLYHGINSLNQVYRLIGHEKKQIRYVKDQPVSTLTLVWNGRGMEKKKFGGDDRFINEYTTFVPAKTNRPSFLFVEYRRVSAMAQGYHNVKG